MNTEEKDIRTPYTSETASHQDAPAEDQKSVYDLSNTELKARNQKRIEITPLDDKLNREFLKHLHGILELRSEVIWRISTVQKLHESIMSDIETLQNSSSISLKEDAAKPFEDTYKKFEQFAHTFLGEIEYHLAVYAQHIQDSPPTHAVVPQNAPDSFEQLIRFAIPFLKIFTKKRKKETALFFSRYEHTYKKQWQRIEHLKRVHEMAQTKHEKHHTHQHNQL